MKTKKMKTLKPEMPSQKTIMKGIEDYFILRQNEDEKQKQLLSDQFESLVKAKHIEIGNFKLLNC